ncbi:helix-turn-helix domain-containing protein [Streptococcus sp. ZJ93]|uniref:helix-turn-helix domain-containing protein n=1 Tax=Streptococcus handemini TaxID=3161188 RepID=UPI0034D75733
MNILGDTIKTIRKSKKMTQTELAKLTGFKQNTISNHENGNRNLDEIDIRKYAEALGVSPQDLFDLSKTSTASPDAKNGTVQAINDKVVQLHPERQENVLEYATEQLEEQIKENTPQPENKVTSISEKRVEYEARKRVEKSAPGKVSAGTGYWQEDDYDTIVSFYEDDIPDDDDYDTIAIVVGHSMEPKIKNGDFLFIKLTNSVDINTIGIFQVDGENYVKKLKNGYLESLNKDYKDIDFKDHDDIRTIGEVVSVYREK